MSASVLQPGYRVGKYEILAHIATGGMGAIYKARDVELGRLVALKILSKDSKVSQASERFKREARHAARLSHPHIVTLYECGHQVDGDLHYLALEFVDGTDLAAYLQRKGKLKPDDARRILIQLTKALEHAFVNGIVHRDIKPANVLLARHDGRVTVKLTDLGLARFQHDENEFKVTREGSTVGTIDYMSPEQARDSWSTDIRGDIYSLGCTAYHMLAGKPPFADGGLGERVYKHMNVPPTDIRDFNDAVSDDFWRILQKMLAKEPADRYATPGELLRALKAIRGEKANEPAKPSAPAVEETPEEEITPAPGILEPSKPRPAKRRRKPRPAPADSGSETVFNQSLLTMEQARAAEAFHARAVQVIEEGGGDDYARQLLDNCLKLDPFNTDYRKTLRRLNSNAAGGTLSRWFGSLNVLATKSKLKLARSNSDWRRVLELGELVLAQQSNDVDTHVAMAEAAEKLGCTKLAIWLIEQARAESPADTSLVRALANVYEAREEWRQALALWEKILAREPNNTEARRKVDMLSVKDHLSTGQYRR